MNHDIILELSAAQVLTPVDEIDPSSVSVRHDGHLIISGKCAVKIERTSAFINRSEDVVVNDSTSLPFATVCFTKDRKIAHFSELTAWQYVAYLTEVTKEEVESSESFLFKSDYVVVDGERLDDYLENYIDGAPIWGGFSHGNVTLSSWSQGVTEIQAVSGIKVPTNHHKESFHRYLNANNSFDRFLRLYHSVELLFDYVTYRKIQALDNDLIGYAAVMKDNGKTEFDRLLSIILEYCLGHDDLGQRMNAARNHKDVCLKIFQEYTKDSNPLTDSSRFEKFWTLVDGDSVSATNVAALKISKEDEVRRFLCRVAAYWIYRIRCSIAHNRVGEFILADEHESFVAEVGIPLLRNVVGQILSEAKFKSLIPAVA